VNDVERVDYIRVPVTDMSGVCHGAEVRDPDGNAILLHHRYRPYEQS
jgi:hypothetical protein